MKYRTCLLFVPFFVVLISCKMSNKESNLVPHKKANIMERTKWKHSSDMTGDPDIILDFYTDKQVQEYLILPDGTEIKANHGTYKVKNQRLIKIKWNKGKYSFENVTGEIEKNTLTIITEKLNKKEYHKIKDY